MIDEQIRRKLTSAGSGQLSGANVYTMKQHHRVANKIHDTIKDSTAVVKKIAHISSTG